MRRLLLSLLPALLTAQYVDDRNLFEVLQDDLDTAKVHANLKPEQRKAADGITLVVVKTAAKQRVHKSYDKAEIRSALKKLSEMMEAKVFVPADIGALREDMTILELGLQGKVDMDAPRRARGSVY